MEYLMQENGFCKGIQIKREPSWDETLYCLNEILGFDVDFTLEEVGEFDDENGDELVEDEKKDIQKTFVDFIKGDADWHWLCDTLYCYDDIDSFTIGNFAYLIKHLEEKGIV